MGRILLLPSRKQLHWEQAARGREPFLHPRGPLSFSHSSEIKESHYNLLDHCLVSQPQRCTRSTLIMQIMQLCHSSRELQNTQTNNLLHRQFSLWGKKQAWLQGASLRPGFHGFSAGSWHECLEHTNSYSVPRNSGHQVPACKTRRGIHLVNLTPHGRHFTRYAAAAPSLLHLRDTALASCDCYLHAVRTQQLPLSLLHSC